MRNALLLLVVALAHVGSAVASDAPQQVSFCDLAKSSKAYAGKQIQVRAIYRYTWESSRLGS